MKILSISDEVDPSLYGPDLDARAAGVEAILSCGDLPFDYLEYLVTFTNAPLFYVRGNHDPPESNGKFPGGCTPLDGRVEELGGHLLAGLSGCRWYSGGANQYTERQMRRRSRILSLRLSLKALSGQRPVLFLSHAAPKDVGDASDPCHRGFDVFRDLTRRHSPSLWVHGHVHLYRREENSASHDALDGSTSVVNAYRYRILEV